MIIDDYFDELIKYQEKYGNKTIILMEVGSFFEMYGVDNEQEKIGDLKKITELLGLALSRRNKSILENSRKNAQMAGFGTAFLKKYLSILINNGYTIVLIEQTTPPPNPIRAVTQIFSPGTYIDECLNPFSNNISCLYIENLECFKTKKTIYACGLSTIDLSTGKSNIYENFTRFGDNNALLEDIYRYIETNSPQELLLIYNINQNSKNLADFEKIFSNKKLYNIKYESSTHNNNYLNEYFRKIYYSKNEFKVNNSLEKLGLEFKINSSYSFYNLLNFAYEHNEKIIDKIDEPIIYFSDENLVLYNNALNQLNVNDSNNSNTLINILSKTSTSMGKRLLKEYLTNPITNINKLEKMYKLVEEFIPRIKDLEENLNNISDIERLRRKVILKMIHPYEFYNMYLSIVYMNKLMCYCESIKELEINKEERDIINKWIDEFERIFLIDEIQKFSINTITNSIFNKGIYKDVDNIQNEMDIIMHKYDLDIEDLNKIAEGSFVRLDNNERDGWFLTITNSKLELLKKKMSKEKYNEYHFKKHSTVLTRIVNTELTNRSNKLVLLIDKIRCIVKERYIETLNLFTEKYDKYLEKYIDKTAYIDYIKSNAKCAKMYHYTKPVIGEEKEDESYIICNSFRHPIIERIYTTESYVTNDIELGYKEIDGILLFGLNGVGKSSYMKAVGLNIIMAQAGMFVPSEKLIYRPFKKIFARISGNDNIYKNQSSFQVEMDELRSILKYSDKNSLVLGDEICRGTETLSGLALITTSIDRFSRNKIKFIFATHLHKLGELIDHNNVKFCHLHVEIKKDNLIYDRKIQEGIGSSLYGIEVAKYLLEDDEFIKNALNIRNKLLGKNIEDGLLSNKQSNYNSKLYIDSCQVCGDKNNLDTHHIKFQMLADEDGFIGHLHKNNLSNLVVLCKKCHDEVHNGVLNINGYKQTIKGIELIKEIITEDEKINKTRKKYSEDDIKKINEYNKPNYNKKFIIEELKNKYGINISVIMLNKIFKGEY